MLARDKHSSLLQKFVTHSRKKFYRIGPRSKVVSHKSNYFFDNEITFGFYCGGATTLSITTLSIMTLSITTLSVTTLSITTLSIMTCHNNIQHNNKLNMAFSIPTLSKIVESQISHLCFVSL